MFPRNPLFPWQDFAQAFGGVKWVFAPERANLQDGFSGGPASQRTPFPSIWLSPAGVEPLFFIASRSAVNRQNSACCDEDASETPYVGAIVLNDVALLSDDITTTSRGTTTCGKSSLFSSLQPRLQPACRTPVRARRPAPSPARLLPMRPMAMSSMARSLAVLRVQRPALFRARSAAERLDLTAFAAGPVIPPTTQRAFPLGGFSFPAPVAALT